MSPSPRVLLTSALMLVACSGNPAGPPPYGGPAAIRITTITTGLDLDPNGYNLAVDGIDGGLVSPIGTQVVLVHPGSRTIALTGLTPNCVVDGSASRTVTVTEDQGADIAFAIVCTATNGVIRVRVSLSGTYFGDSNSVMVDGGRRRRGNIGRTMTGWLREGHHEPSPDD